MKNDLKESEYEKKNYNQYQEKIIKITYND